MIDNAKSFKLIVGYIEGKLKSCLGQSCQSIVAITAVNGQSWLSVHDVSLDAALRTRCSAAAVSITAEINGIVFVGTDSANKKICDASQGLLLANAARCDWCKRTL